jgi:hypothetical protein
MDFFIISQDNSIPDPVQPAGILQVIDRNKIKPENIHKMDEIAVQFEVKENSKAIYVDFIENPVPLVSDKLKDILEKYEERIFFKPILLADIKKSRQDVYWLLVPDSIECLSDKSEFNKNDTIKRIVLDEKKVKYRKVFKVKGILENLIIVRLDVAESILRRGFTGITLKKVEMG